MMHSEMKHGFILKNEEFVNEINSMVRIMEHEKSGARLMHIHNDDDNKTFSIAFRTPPNDDTGLPHILEHAVLCGSRKFPVKEPFVELAKGSLNTYLNAMTYADKTVYPIASQNNKDFINLMDVYLDAVFFPNIYDNPMILKQEGWNYKLDQADDDLEYQGVVYNEMKGAFSSPEGVLSRKIKESLFPDTTYHFESGGDPEYIPQLTQEQFLAFHKQYYHPSNSYICLYGDGDIDEHLKLINEGYLSHFNKLDIDSAIQLQEPFATPREVNLTYPIAEGESEDGKTYLALNFAIEDTSNKEMVMAIQILSHLLLDTPAAPLKKALIDAQIGQDVFGSYNTSLRQPVFSIIVKNSSPDKKEKFYNIVKDTLEGLVEKGIDKKLVEGAINTREFDLREGDFGGYSKGLLYATESLKSWLYGKDPLMYLKYEEDLKNVKEALKSDYLEEVIQKQILGNSHSTLVMMEPKAGLLKEKDILLKEKLSQFKESLTEEQINELIDQTQELQVMQTTPDKEENLEKIPTLTLADLEKNISLNQYETKEKEGIPFIFTPELTNQIAYVNVYYDLRGVEEELIPYIGIMTALLGKLDSQNYSYESLNNMIDIHTGGIQYYTLVLNDGDNPKEYIPKLVVRSKVLYHNISHLSQLINEVLLNTKFDKGNRIREIIRELKSRMEMSISRDGHRVAFGRLASYFSQKSYYDEILKGLDFYQFICDLEKNFDKMESELITNLEKAYKILSNKNRMEIGLTCEADAYTQIQDSLLTITKGMEGKSYDLTLPAFNLGAKNEGLLTPFDVQYVAIGYDFRQLGYKYSGTMSVLKNILGLDYLWNKVRVQNGAYGCFAEFGRNGTMFFVSYRDPSVGKTIDIYNQSVDYVRSFDVSDRDMVKYIIGTISKLDFPLTPGMKGERSERLYIAGITKEMLQEERNDILSTNQEKIRSLAPVIQECLSKEYICILGNHDKLQKEKGLFDNFIDVFQ